MQKEKEKNDGEEGDPFKDFASELKKVDSE